MKKNVIIINIIIRGCGGSARCVVVAVVRHARFFRGLTD